jgi:hypothetical protein
MDKSTNPLSLRAKRLFRLNIDRGDARDGSTCKIWGFHGGDY